MKVLVISRGVVSRHMGAPGLRSYHMAHVIAQQLPDAQVTLAAPNDPGIPSPHPRLRLRKLGGFKAGLRQVFQHDIIISRDFPLYTIPFFLSKRFVFDAFAVLSIEWMALSQRIPDWRQRRIWTDTSRRYVNLQLTLADYIICSNEPQRDFWVGALSSLGLLAPETYDRDPTLRGLIDVAPHGVRPGQPQRTPPVLKGVVPGINEDDKVLIWNSSITEWFDAETVIRAVAQISRIRDDVKLFIIGTEHPDLVASTGTGPVQRAINVAKETGTYDRSVFLNVAWVPYEEVGGYLRESYIGVCAAYEGFETEIAYRTRYVDLFWAELPIVCTGGDVLAKEIEARGAGIVVPPGDIDAFAEAVLSLLDDPDAYARCKRGMSAMRAEHPWERALAPLVRFCQSESIAKRKRSRVLPLFRRVIPYLIGSARQRRDVY